MENEACIEKKDIIRNLVIISVIYLLTHGFMLVLTGTWWDEKTWFFCSKEKMWEVSLQLGKPSTYFLMLFIRTIPEWLGRILIFILYYLTSLGIYIIYRQLPFIDNKICTFMTLIYIVIPANDARVLRGVFPYTIGYFFFIFGFCLLIALQKKYNYKNNLLRILVLLTFTCSYILNSNLVFYAIPLLYIFIYIIKNKKLKICYKFLDFVILPFAYFIVKNKFYPAYGSYVGYNSVSLDKIIQGGIDSIIECIYTLKNIGYLYERYIWIGASGGIIVFLLFLMLKIVQKINIKRKCYNTTALGRVTLFFIGCLVMYLGVFPYKVVGHEQILVGVGGRSSILIGGGAAIIIYAIISWLPYAYFRTYIGIIIVICGICHFNYFYLLYQQDYYRQLDMVYELKENQDLLYEKKNILYLTDYQSEIDVTRFYSLNSNAKDAFGDESHFIMNGISDYSYLNDSEDTMYMFVNNGDYQMKDYEVGRNDEIEAIIVYHDGIKLRETLMMKFLEIVNDEKFEERLYSQKNLDIYLVGTKDFANIYSNLIG